MTSSNKTPLSFGRRHFLWSHPMNSAIRSVASVMTGALVVLLESAAASAQATVDAENSHASVGALMVWRVDALMYAAKRHGKNSVRHAVSPRPAHAA